MLPPCTRLPGPNRDTANGPPVASAVWGAIAGTLAQQTDLDTALGAKQATAEKNAANGYAGLNSVSRTIKGVDSTDDLIVDASAKGLVLKDALGNYWRLSLGIGGVLATTLLEGKP